MNFVFSINWNCNAKYFLVPAFFELNEKKNFVILIIVSKERGKMNHRIRWHIYFLKCIKIISSVERLHSATSKRETNKANAYFQFIFRNIILCNGFAICNQYTNASKLYSNKYLVTNYYSLCKNVHFHTY